MTDERDATNDAARRDPFDARAVQCRISVVAAMDAAAAAARSTLGRAASNESITHLAAVLSAQAAALARIARLADPDGWPADDDEARDVLGQRALRLRVARALRPRQGGPPPELWVHGEHCNRFRCDHCFNYLLADDEMLAEFAALLERRRRRPPGLALIVGVQPPDEGRPPGGDANPADPMSGLDDEDDDAGE